MDLQRKWMIEKMREDFLKDIILEVSIERSSNFLGVPSREKYCRTKEKLEQGKFWVCSKNYEDLIVIKC